ncbi:MAG: hypothetical protein ACK58N_03285 [Synechocystis sp.]
MARAVGQLNGELTALIGSTDDGNFALVVVNNGGGDRHYQPDLKRNLCCKA